jgi:hypothetical protein
MNVVPVAENSQNQKQKGNQEQSGCLRRVNRVAMVFMGMIALGIRFRHLNIVALGQTKSPQR